VDWVLATWAIRVRYRAVFWVLAFPLVWVAFTIVRGSITGWWPYWFLDPTGAGGVGSMLMYIFGRYDRFANSQENSACLHGE
jgi:hypothetical protein